MKNIVFSSIVALLFSVNVMAEEAHIEQYHLGQKSYETMVCIEVVKHGIKDAKKLAIHEDPFEAKRFEVIQCNGQNIIDFAKKFAH